MVLLMTYEARILKFCLRITYRTRIGHGYAPVTYRIRFLEYYGFAEFAYLVGRISIFTGPELRSG